MVGLDTLVRRLLGERWQRWLDKRIPATRRQTLGHRSIFILPTGIGLLYGLLVLLLLVTAINYKSSLIYALTFWLFSVGLSAMYITFRNLKGLSLVARDANNGFAGQSFDIPIELQAGRNKRHWSMWLQYPGNPGELVSLGSEPNKSLLVHYKSAGRGRLQPGRLLLESRFPLGLFRAWSWILLDFNTLVYPKPEQVPLIVRADGDGGELEGAARDVVGDQDFRGLRPYQAGDSLKQIAWKQLARGKGLVTKEFDSDDGASCWLDWANVNGDVEYRLSCLVGWVLHAHEQGWQYGLRLPGVERQPQHSERHLQRCLRSLALYGLAESNGGLADTAGPQAGRENKEGTAK